MLRYILRRLAGAAVVLTLLSFLVFSLLYLVPGDPVKILVGTRRLTPEVRQAVTRGHRRFRRLSTLRNARDRRARLARVTDRLAHHRRIHPRRRRRHPPGDRCGTAPGILG